MPSRVSLSMIVRNEEANLPACLASAADLVSQLVVVDTGSTDRTRAIAARCGALVVDFPWTDDFAAARNESLRHVTGDWVFWLDADDRIDADNRRRLRALFAGLEPGPDAYLMRCVSLPSTATGQASVLDLARLFPNHPEVRWQYRVHEQILPAVQRRGGALRWTDVVIQHTGYQDAALQRRKLERNLRLSQLDQRDRPDDSFVLFHLGKTYLNLGRPGEALPVLRRSLDRVAPDNSILPGLHELLARTHRQLGQAAEALAVCRAGRARLPGHAGLLFQEALLLCERGDFGPAEACLRRLLELPAEKRLVGTEEPGIRGFLARHNLAMICFRQGRAAEAEAQWTAALAERPDFAQAWFGLGDLWLAQGRPGELDRAADRLENDPGRAVEATLLRARAHMARQDFAAARQVLEEALGRSPQSVWPRVLLSHALLQEGRDLAAAEKVLREILALDPGNAQARGFLAQLLARQGRRAT